MFEAESLVVGELGSRLGDGYYMHKPGVSQYSIQRIMLLAPILREHCAFIIVLVKTL